MLAPRERVGKLEVAIVIAVVVMFIAGFLSMAYVIQQGVTAQARERLARRDRELLLDTSLNVLQLMKELRAAVAAIPANQDALIRRILEEIRKLEERQTQIIVREQRTAVVVVTASPQPQPTRTVYRPCQVNPVTRKCLNDRRQ